MLEPQVVPRGTTGPAVRRRPRPPVWWLVGTGLLVLTFALAVPEGARTHLRLSDLDRPDDRWTLEDLRAALAGAGVPVPAYLLFVHVTGQLLGATFLVVGAVIGRLRPRDPGALRIGLLLAFAGWGLAGTHTVYEALLPQWAVPLRALGTIAWVCLPGLLYVFPDGRFRPRWTAVAAGFGVCVAVLDATGGWTAGLAPGNRPWVLDVVVDLVFLGVPLVVQVLRFRAADEVRRQQTKWVLWSLVVLAVGGVAIALVNRGVPGFGAPGVAGLLQYTAANLALVLLVALVPVAVGISLSRHRLWDVDPLLNRTLVWTVVTASTVLVYLLVAALVNSLLRTPGNVVGSVLGAGVVAVLFEPTRRRVQAVVNRVTFGDRDTPHVVVSRLSRVADEAAGTRDLLTGFARTVRESLRLPRVEVDLLDAAGLSVDRGCDVRRGTSPPGDVVVLDLRGRGSTVGRLHLTHREPGEFFGPAEQRLVGEVCRHVATVLAAVRATDDLRRARERLVATGQEERRRTRRHLHDEVGPLLAALGMNLDVAAATVQADPDRGRELLGQVRDQVDETIGLVRDVVYGLYPPVLEQLGLRSALTELVETRLPPTGTAFELDLPDHLDPLPAAVEVAVYRIASEAVTNVARHAHASLCRLRLALRDGGRELDLEVRDDGRGAAGARPGVGLLAMAERAHEIGGAFHASSPVSGGHLVRATFPLREPS